MKIYLINLDRQPERLDSATKELSKIDFIPTRVSAVDMHDSDLNKSNYVTDGVRACWLSHVKALELISQCNDEMAFVAEDDLEIINPRAVRKLINNRELLSWDLVQIGHITPGILNKIVLHFRNIEHSLFRSLAFLSSKSLVLERKFGRRLRVRVSGSTPSSFVPDDFLPGTHAYLISRKMAREVISMNSPQFLSADDFFTALAHMRTFKVMRVRNSLVNQAKFKGFGGERFLKYSEN